jgi:uncharacterized membrane protein
LSDTSPSLPTAAPSRGRRWLLVGSLALNFLFVGGLTALWLKGPPGPGHWGGPSQTAFGLMRFSRDLPPDRRDAVRQHLRQARQDFKLARAELRAARQKAAEVLGSPAYSPEQLQMALQAIAAAENRMREVGTNAIMKAIGELTPDDRKKLAEAWNRRLSQEQRRKAKPEGSPDNLPDGPPEDLPNPR